MKREDGHIVETAREARGAEPGPSVAKMVAWGTGLVVAGFIVVYFVYFAG